MTAIDPRFKSTIPVHAGVTQFKPAALDPLGQLNRDLPLLESAARDAEARCIELTRQRSAGEIAGAEADELLAEAMAQKASAFAAITERRAEAEALAKAIGNSPVFVIKVPTAIEREQINVRLVEMGLTTISDEQVRASLIETIYEVDWCSELQRADLDLETYRDQTASELESFWQRQRVQSQAMAEWSEQATERLLDMFNGAPRTDWEEPPVRVVSVREEAKMQLLVDRLMEEPRMRRILARKLDFSRRNAMIIVRIHLRAVDGLGIDPVPDPFTDALSEQSAAAVREALEQRYGRERGDRAWLELVAFIDGLYVLEDFERGNFDSPLAKRPDPTGSPEPSGDTSINGGNSTGSDTGPARDAGSATITAKSSGSTSGAVTQITSNGPTAEG